MVYIDLQKTNIVLIKRKKLLRFSIHRSPQNVFETTPFDFKNHNGPSTPAGYSILFQTGVVLYIFDFIILYLIMYCFIIEKFKVP